MKVNTQTPEFVSFINAIAEKSKVYHDKTFPNLNLAVFKIEQGKRYIRIWRDTSAYAFVDMTNGDVLMPASWKAPAKGARGNIFNADNGLDCTGPYGIAYIKGPNCGWNW